MRHEIPRASWPVALREAIEKVSDGDIILCHSEPMQELGQRAHERMCPEKRLTFEINPI